MSVVGGGSSTLIRLLTVGNLLNLFSSKKLKILGHKPNCTDIDRLMTLYSEGVITPIIDSVYPLEELPSAMEHYRLGHQKGKVIIDLT